jgi:AraC-like DNA-binding protein
VRRESAHESDNTDASMSINPSASDYPRGHIESWRQDDRARIVFPCRGLLVIVTETSSFVLQPRSALWLPAGMRYEYCCRTDVSLSTLEISDTAALGMPPDARLFEVSPLLKELLIAATRVTAPYDPQGRDGRLLALILDEAREASRAALVHLPMPRDQRLLKVCEAVLKAPAQKSDLDDWARSARIGRRTFTRAFRAQTQMSFAEWRRRARLLESLSRLAAGHTVTAVALDIGYSTASAFNAMFRQAVGVSPSRYAADGPSTVERSPTRAPTRATTRPGLDWPRTSSPAGSRPPP